MESKKGSDTTFQSKYLKKGGPSGIHRKKKYLNQPKSNNSMEYPNASRKKLHSTMTAVNSRKGVDKKVPNRRGGALASQKGMAPRRAARRKQIGLQNMRNHQNQPSKRVSTSQTSRKGLNRTTRLSSSKRLTSGLGSFKSKLSSKSQAGSLNPNASERKYKSSKWRGRANGTSSRIGGLKQAGMKATASSSNSISRNKNAYNSLHSIDKKRRAARRKIQSQVGGSPSPSTKVSQNSYKKRRITSGTGRSRKRYNATIEDGSPPKNQESVQRGQYSSHQTPTTTNNKDNQDSNYKDSLYNSDYMGETSDARTSHPASEMESKRDRDFSKTTNNQYTPQPPQRQKQSDIQEEQEYNSQAQEQSNQLSSYITQVQPGMGPLGQLSSNNQGSQPQSRKTNTFPQNSTFQTANTLQSSPLDHTQRENGKIIDQGYYMKLLREAYLCPDSEINAEYQNYKEHFNQTCKSIVFLNNVDIIDEFSLVEKKVYLPPNTQRNF